MKVLHVITGLGVGGAETMLLRLIEGADTEVSHMVVSLTDAEPLGREIEEAGAPVTALGMRGVAHLPKAVLRLRRLVREQEPDVVQTWLYHGDLVGALAARGLGVPIAWNLRHSDLSRNRNKRSTLLTMKACALLSRRIPTRIISCSATAIATHVEAGYDPSKMVLIPNGFDTNQFNPAPEGRVELRRELGLGPDALVTATVGRYHPQKDPATLLKAAGNVLPHRPRGHLVLVGRGFTTDNGELMRLIDDHGLRGRVHPMGLRRDVARLDAALDLFISSSAGEAFPNAVGEAMSCGVPCIVTDVGDVSDLIGETGRIVPPRDPEALAAAWAELLDKSDSERATLGKTARRRIQERFSMQSILARYQRVWGELAGLRLEDEGSGR